MKSAAEMNTIQGNASVKNQGFLNMLSNMTSSAKTGISSIRLPSMTSSAKPDEVVKKLVELKIITPNASAPGYIKILDSLISGTIKSPYDITKDDITESTILGDIRYYIMSNYGAIKLPANLTDKQNERIKNILNDSEGDSKIWYDEFIKLYTKIGTPIAYADKVAFNSALAVIDPKIITQGSVGYTIDKIDAYTKTPGPYFIIGTKFANPAVQDEITGGSNYIFMDGNGTISDGMKEHDWGKKDNNLIFKPWGTNVKGGATKSRRRKSKKGTRRSR
jgi:hypothetical protein